MFAGPACGKIILGVLSEIMKMGPTGTYFT